MDIKEILEKHKLWLSGSVDGVRANLRGADLSVANLRGADLSVANLSGADLSGADLSRANLSWANLSRANLSWANLSWANLSESTGIIYAQASWSGHGECGRQLLGVLIADEILLFCGCFRGTEAELREYIAKGKTEYVASRTKVMEFILSCLKN